MTFNRSLIPWNWGLSNLPVRKEDNEPPVCSSFQQEINRVFEDFLAGVQMRTAEGKNIFEPRLDMTETEKEVKVTVELPGMDEKDIDLSIADNALTIRGEKREEKEDRTYGQQD